MLLEKTAMTLMASIAAAFTQLAIVYPEQLAEHEAATQACADAKRAVQNADVDWINPEVKALLKQNQVKACSTA